MNPEIRPAWFAPKYDPAIASIRLRCLQVLEEPRLGIPAERFREQDLDRYSAVVFSKAYDSRALDLAAALASRGKRVCFDICDNHSFGAEGSAVLTERRHRLQRMLGLAHHVTVSTPVLRDQLAEEFPGTEGKMSVIPDPLDRLATSPVPRPGLASRVHLWRLRRFLSSRQPRLKLIWFGNHGVNHAEGGMRDLIRVRDPIEAAHRRFPITLTVVSNSYRKYRLVRAGWNIPTLYLPWNASSFGTVLRMHDVAILPITRNPFTEAKTINRAATALLADLGVVADAIPSYEELRTHIFLDDWAEGLRHYAENRASEGARIQAARNQLLERYSTPTIAAQWRDLLVRLHERPGQTNQRAISG
jgi:hypothetical protein